MIPIASHLIGVSLQDEIQLTVLDMDIIAIAKKLQLNMACINAHFILRTEDGNGSYGIADNKLVVIT